jgi:hypothetical protein
VAVAATWYVCVTLSLFVFCFHCTRTRRLYRKRLWIENSLYDCCTIHCNFLFIHFFYCAISPPHHTILHIALTFCFSMKSTPHPTKISIEDMTSVTEASSYDLHSPRGTSWNRIFKCGCCLPHKQHHEEELHRGLDTPMNDATGKHCAKGMILCGG